MIKTCELCKHEEATIHIKNKQGILDLCQECLKELQESLGYYINSNEVVIEEWNEKTKN